ncbi:MAG: amino acid permease [Thermoplasmata archaeon]
MVIGAIIASMAAGISFDISYQMTSPRTESSFWIVFAVFFPAATGIMAGANMSGELKDPRNSIPLGTLSAILVSLVIYMMLAYWFAGLASPAELVSNFTIMIDRAFFGPLVLGGLLAATFSSALNSMVGASRILQAMSTHHILPGNKWLSKKSGSGEPKNAILFTALIVSLGLLTRDLNTIAPLITMFFLERLLSEARMPIDDVIVKATTTEEWLDDAPQADLNIFSLPPNPDFDKIRYQLEKSNSACMYCRDSTRESVLA